MQPCVSVVVAARNAESFVGAALASIPLSASQDITYEVLLADGHSSDRTIEIACAVPNVRLVSSRDSGIYDGMNRAISAAQGEFVIILNSDDMLLPGGLGKLIHSLKSQEQAELASGGIVFGDTISSGAKLHNDARVLSADGVMFGIPAINARLFRRRALLRLGPFRTDIGLGADRELLLRAVRTDICGISVNQPVYFYRTHRQSQTLSRDAAGRRRIYESDLQLAAALLSDAVLMPQERKIIQAFSALSQLKYRRAMGEAASRSGNADVARPGVSDMARGLGLYLRWRNTLSGF